MSNWISPLAWLARHPITRRYPVRTSWRWLYWQARQLVTDKPKVMSFVRGTQLAVYPREGLTGYWYVVQPEYEEMSFLERFLRPGDTFLDVGANAGAFAVLAVSFGCQVVAFEPVPSAFRRLEENAALNHRFGSITALNQAAGSAAATLRMSTGFGTGNRILRTGEDLPSTEVAVVTLESAIPTLSKPTFVKIDVEGHEWEVIQGATALLQSEHLIGLMIETFRSHNWKLPGLRSLEDRLREYGFEPYHYEVETNSILRLDRPDEGLDNTFYFRAPQIVERRLQGEGRVAEVLN